MKISTNQKFFLDKNMYFAEEIYKKCDKELLKLLNNIKINRDTILNRVSEIMLHYEVSDNVLNMDNKAIQLEFKRIGITINDILKSEYEDEKGNINSFLVNVGTDKYLTNSYILDLGLDFKLKKIDGCVLNKIIDKKIEGKNFSTRLYDNKCNDIAKRLKKDIYDYLQGKTSVNDIENNIKTTFNINANNTKRLFQTETARVQEEINSTWQDEHNIESVMYVATLDNLICSECGEYDGEIFPIGDKPVDLPLHPNCRCTYVSLPNEDYKPSNRLDNNTKETINWSTYADWKEENGL